MRLYIDGWRADGRTGVARYLTNIVEQWSGDAVASAFDGAWFCTPRPMPQLDARLPANLQRRVFGPDLPMLVWQTVALGPRLRDGVLWCPSYSTPVASGARVVVTTHDATHAIFPELYPRIDRLFYTRWYGWCARHASLVITNNATTRDDIVRAYGVPIERTRVVPLAPAAAFSQLSCDRTANETRARFSAGQPYFLNVGTQSRRRNVPTLIRGFAEFKRRTGAPHKLVLVGRSPPDLDVPSIASGAGIGPGELVHQSYVSDADLNALYNACEAFVLVAAYEANSLTAIEAQTTGTPIVVADTPGMREMTGGQALFLQRVEEDKVADALAAIAGDSELRADLGRRSWQYAQQFSWKRTAAATMAVLAEAASMPVRRTARRLRHG